MLKNEDFPEGSIVRRYFDVSNIKRGSKLHTLLKKLNSNATYSSYEDDDSIMLYDKICTCDDGFLCEHRLKWILDFIKDNYERQEKLERILND